MKPSSFAAFRIHMICPFPGSAAPLDLWGHFRRTVCNGENERENDCYERFFSLAGWLAS